MRCLHSESPRCMTCERPRAVFDSVSSLFSAWQYTTFLWFSQCVVQKHSHIRRNAVAKMPPRPTGSAQPPGGQEHPAGCGGRVRGSSTRGKQDRGVCSSPDTGPEPRSTAAPAAGLEPHGTTGAALVCADHLGASVAASYECTPRVHALCAESCNAGDAVMLSQVINFTPKSVLPHSASNLSGVCLP